MFTPHSHDAADSALEASEDGIRAVKISLVALPATSILQALVVVLTGSVALLAETIHNFSDALTAVPLWIAFVLGRRVASRRYTYGYGRAEDLAGFPLADPIIGLLITVAILFVLRGAATDIYRRLMDAVDPELVDLAEKSLRSVPGVLAVEELRLRWIGHRVRAETGIVVDPELSIVAAHDIATEAKHTLLHNVPKLVAATVHVSPRDTDGHDHHAALAHHPTALEPGAITR
jgi:divalent metal cation (Fe/Co/Zn/Cd) transporter